jgi:signal transduction histidine kinase
MFVSSVEHPDVVVPPLLVAAGRRIAGRCWAEQRAILISRFRDRSDLVDATDQRTILDFLETLDRSSVLIAPLGAGPECLGVLVLSRDADGPSWTEVEAQAALDIGRDLGAALQSARLRSREQEPCGEPRDLDSYKCRLIGTIAREFKHPLASIIGSLEQVELDQDHPERLAASLATLARGSAQLIELVDQLVELQRVSDPDIDRVVEPVDLGRCLRRAADRVAARFGFRPVELSTPEAVVAGVRTELESVCANLLDNALKYTESGGAVRASVRREGGCVVLSVADDGPGITVADQEHVFEEFFRTTRPEATRRPGSGLGLAIVARVVERHHGTLDVDSAPGLGTTVEVRLPEVR